MSIEIKEDIWDVKSFCGINIRIRKSDGYFNATDMCKVKNNEWSNYFKNKRTLRWLKNYEKRHNEVPYNYNEKPYNYKGPLVDTITTGANEFRGTWVHPDVAIHLAIWLDDDFSYDVIQWVKRFINGDITLVQDIIERHDQINDTQSQVFVDTMSNQLQEYKEQVSNLSSINNSMEVQLGEYKEQFNNIIKVKDSLSEQITKLNEFRCKYCTRRYSSTLGLSRHLNHNCVDKYDRDMSLVIDYDLFKSYLDLILDLLTEYTIEDFNYTLNSRDWNGDNPVLVVKNTSTEKKFSFKVKLNESRWRAVKFLQRHLNIPLDMLLDKVSKKVVEDNKSKLKYIVKFLNNTDEEVFLEEEFKIKLGLVDGN